MAVLLRNTHLVVVHTRTAVTISTMHIMMLAFRMATACLGILVIFTAEPAQIRTGMAVALSAMMVS